jgi:hypothetical protein
MTVTIGVPMLTELLQANHDLRREVADLRIELSARVQAVETHLTSQRTDNSTLTVPSQDFVHNVPPLHEDHRYEDLHVDQDLDVEINGSSHQNVNTQRDVHTQQDHHAQQHDRVAEDASSRDTSSPSVDEGLTITDHVSSLPGVGHKRKRTTRPAVGTSPYINHSGFVVRGSDTQLAQRKAEDPGPSRSESPFDSTNDSPDTSSDRLDYIPPVRPLSRSMASPSRRRPQRAQTDVEQSDVDEANEQGNITLRYNHYHLRVLFNTDSCNSQYGRPRRPAQRLPGFVDIPKPKEFAQMLRQQKKKK